MKLIQFFGSLLLVLFFMSACNREDFTFDNPSKELRFSKDTLVCDTVYNQVRSSTYVLKVYNQENKNIKIPKISLESGENSLYRINVDGKSGSSCQDVMLRAKDSLFVFVEIAPSISGVSQMVAEDKILFQGVKKQEVSLLSLVKDAEFFISTKQNPKVLSSTTWNSQKAKIIYGELQIAKGASLKIEKATNVYFHKNSGIRLLENASMDLQGSKGQEVVFRGDRNEPRYDTIAANWKGITLDKGSSLVMNYARVFGGMTGIYSNHAVLELNNSILHTFQNYGMQCIASSLSAKNLVVSNCGDACFGIFSGGNYQLLHSTIANYWSRYSSGLALSASTSFTQNGESSSGNLNLQFKNSILYSSGSSAVNFASSVGSSSSVFDYLFDSCLLKYDQKTAGFTADNNSLVQNCILNQDPLFVQKSIAKLYLGLQEKSPAKARANASVASLVPVDIVGTNRTSSPSIGAYQ